MINYVCFYEMMKFGFLLKMLVFRDIDHEILGQGFECYKKLIYLIDILRTYTMEQLG